MRKRPPYIPQRRPIFVGCEGESEQGYATLLQDLAHEAGLQVHLKIEVLRGGDPLARIEQAKVKLAQFRKTRGVITDKFVMLDTDQLSLDPDRAIRAKRLADAEGIRIIWQEPCFEAFLLRHFNGCVMRRPPTNIATQEAILNEWPQYKKAMSRAELARKINLDSVVRAAVVERDLMDMIRCIGLIAE